jgi:hypothetical protein
LEGYRLKEDEYFKLQIWLDDPQGPDSREFLLNSPRLDDEFIYPENGKVKWTVTVVQAADVNCVNSLCAGTTLNELSSASELRWFAYDNLGQVGEGVVQSPPIPTTALAIAAVTPTPLPAHQYTIRNVFGQVNEAITQIRGDIQDPNGQPVNGVRVRVRSGSFCTVSYPSGPTGGYPNGVYDILLNSRAKDGMWQVAVVDGPADSTNTACDSNLDVLSEEVTVPTNTLEGVVFVEWRKNY